MQKKQRTTTALAPYALGNAVRGALVGNGTSGMENGSGQAIFA